VGAIGEEKKIFCPAAIRTPNRAAWSLVTILTTLSRLLGCMWKKKKKKKKFVDLFFSPLLHLTYMQGLPVLLCQSIKTWDKPPSIRDLCTGSRRKVSLPLQLVFPSYPLIKMAVRDLQMFWWQSTCQVRNSTSHTRRGAQEPDAILAYTSTYVLTDQCSLLGTKLCPPLFYNFIAFYIHC